MIQQGAFETAVLFSRPKRLLHLLHPDSWFILSPRITKSLCFNLQVSFSLVNQFITTNDQVSLINDILWYWSFSLTHFTVYDPLEIHPGCCRWHYFTLFLPEQYPIMSRYHSSVHGHGGYFPLLACVNYCCTECWVASVFLNSAFPPGDTQEWNG